MEGPAHVLCDNLGVVKDTRIPESILHKKHNVVNYNSVCEAVAAYTLRIGKEYGENNLTDLLEKVMNGQKRCDLCHHIFC